MQIYFSQYRYKYSQEILEDTFLAIPHFMRMNDIYNPMLQNKFWYKIRISFHFEGCY